MEYIYRLFSQIISWSDSVRIQLRCRLNLCAMYRYMENILLKHLLSIVTSESR